MFIWCEISYNYEQLKEIKGSINKKNGKYQRFNST